MKTYNYTQLNDLEEDMALTEQEINFYGVVIDASFPYFKGGRWVATAKVIDASTMKEDEYTNVVFLSTKFEDLPIIQRVGDILRCHRAQLEYYKDHKQLKVNVSYKSAWCLYIGDNKSPALEPMVLNEEEKENYFENTPYNFSGKSFSQKEDEKQTLNKMRSWLKKLLIKYSLIDRERVAHLQKLRNAAER